MKKTLKKQKAKVKLPEQMKEPKKEWLVAKAVLTVKYPADSEYSIKSVAATARNYFSKLLRLTEVQTCCVVYEMLRQMELAEEKTKLEPGTKNAKKRTATKKR